MDQDLGEQLIAYYGRLENVHSGVYEQAEKAYRKFNEDNFDQTKTRVNESLKRALGERRAVPYLIAKLDRIAGTLRHRAGLSLPPEAITVAASLPQQQDPAAPPYDPSSEDAQARNPR